MWRRDTAAVKATAGKDCSSMRLMIMTKFPELCENGKKTTIKCQCFVSKRPEKLFCVPHKEAQSSPGPSTAEASLALA